MTAKVALAQASDKIPIQLVAVDASVKAPSVVIYDPRIKALAAHAALESKPRHPEVHLIRGAKNSQLLVVNGSQLKTIEPAVEQQIRQLIERDSSEKSRLELNEQLALLGFDCAPAISAQPLKDPATHALSLAIVQKCNMGCTYCYAEQGDFGGSAKSMTLATAQQAIDFLLANKVAGDHVTLSFMGGEPLMNRKDLRAATVYALKQATLKGVSVGFSITTNGTLLEPEDAIFFEQHGFAVTVSIDGLEQQHDQQRPMKSGGSSYQRIIKRVQPLLRLQRKMQVSARVTVTPQNMNLVETLDALIAMGFHSVGFSPLLKSSTGKGEMTKEDLAVLLQGMIACGLRFEQQVLQGKRYPFLNLINAHKELGKATHRPYPCGAGAGYLGVSADGELAACHRFVNDDNGRMGNLSAGIDPQLQNQWLAQRHVQQQSPCNSCWARYMCAGSCHHEVIEQGRVACDYIRGWLHFSLQSFDRLNRLAPHWMK